jgi:hypothetical protein
LIIIPLLFIFKNIFLNFWPKMLLKRMAHAVSGNARPLHVLVQCTQKYRDQRV